MEVLSDVPGVQGLIVGQVLYPVELIGYSIGEFLLFLWFSTNSASMR